MYREKIQSAKKSLEEVKKYFFTACVSKKDTKERKMSFIYLDEKCICLFLILLILMLGISLGCLICAANTSKKNSEFEKLLLNEKKKVIYLNRLNFELKLKNKEFEGEE